MIREIICLLQKAVKLWQSKNVDDKYLKFGVILFAIMGVVCLLLSYLLHSGNIILDTIAEYTFLYSAIMTFFISVDCLIYYFYTYNSFRHFQKVAKYLLFSVIIFLLALTLIIGIPGIIALGIIGKIIDFRAKKIDNLINFLLYFVISLIIIYILSYPNYLFAFFFSNWLVYLLGLKLSLNLDVYCISLFMFLYLFKLQIDTFFRGLLFIRQKKSYKTIVKNLETAQTILDNNIDPSTFDIQTHKQAKDEILRSKENKLKKNLNFDLTYIKNTLRKVELAILILLFVMVSLRIAPIESLEYLNKHQSDTINILTIYTLIMLYSDKRKEWK